MCKNCYIWGLKEQYDIYINFIKFEELKGNLKVCGIVSDDEFLESFDGYPVINKKRVSNNIDIDVVILISTDFFIHTTECEISSVLPDVTIITAKVFTIPDFDFGRYMSLLNSRCTIVSPTCWGGLTYNSLAMRFESPFINLIIQPEQYLKLLSNFEYYISQPLLMLKDRDCSGNPIGILGDIEIDFVHYKNFEQALEFWNKRLRRTNLNNLFIYMQITNEKLACQFADLKIGKKRGFCSFPVEPGYDLYYVKDFEKSQEAIRTLGGNFSRYMNDQARRKLYSYDDEIGNRGAKTIKIYDVLKLLNGDRDFFR